MPVAVGDQVGPDGRVPGIRNFLVTRDDLAKAEAAVALRKAGVATLTARLDRLAQLDGLQEEAIRRHGEVLGQDLAIAVAGARRELTLIGQRLRLVRSMTERKVTLGRSGTAPQSTIDEARVAVLELELLQAELRLDALARGMPLLEDGDEPNWATPSRTPLQLDRLQAAAALAEAEAKLAEAVTLATRATYTRNSEGTVTAPPGALVWSIIVGAGAAVEAGSPFAKWLDCSVLLVDVPVSDVEAALVRPAMPAEIVIEGETRVRRGSVLLARGAAGTIGEDDLAAIAKGRRPGIGQVILRLEPVAGEQRSCPVGLAASVAFPGIGLLDLLPARLGVWRPRRCAPLAPRNVSASGRSPLPPICASWYRSCWPA